MTKFTLLLCCFLVPLSAFSDTLYDFRGFVDSPPNALWDVKGLPYHDGDPVLGSFSYAAGALGGHASLAFSIAGHAYQVTNVFSNAGLSGQEGSQFTVLGYLPELAANVEVLFMGNTHILGGCNSSQACFYGWQNVPIPDVIASFPWTITELQIRQGELFGSHVYSNNLQASMFLDAPIQASIASPEPSSMILLGTGVLLLFLKRRA